MRFLKVWLPLSLFISPSLVLADPLDRLIAEEKKQYQEWIFSEEDLPAVFLTGDSNSVLIYSSQFEGSQEMQLCAEVSWEELIEHSKPHSYSQQVQIDFMVPRIRNTWAATCLIRPFDEILAIGRGSQQKVVIDHFVINTRPDSCGGSSMEIRAVLQDPLPPDPLFYSTDPDLKAGDNRFFSLSVSTDGAQNELWKALLGTQVQFFDEYDVQYQVAHVISSTAVFVFGHLKKSTVSSDDIGLSHEIVAVIGQNGVQILADEPITKDQQSGHVYLLDIIDFNFDGLPDVILDGDRQGCFFRRVFVGSEHQFREVFLPQAPCPCR